MSFRPALLALAATLTLGLPALAGDPPSSFSVEKKVKAKKVDKFLVGTWAVYPHSEPLLSGWLQGMAGLHDRPIKDIVDTYRLDDASAQQLETLREQGAMAPPDKFLEVYGGDGIVIIYEDDGSMMGKLGSETMGGSYTITDRGKNYTMLMTQPESVPVELHWIDKNRFIWRNPGQDSWMAAARQ